MFLYYGRKLKYWPMHELSDCDLPINMLNTNLHIVPLPSSVPIRIKLKKKTTCNFLQTFPRHMRAWSCLNVCTLQWGSLRLCKQVWCSLLKAARCTQCRFHILDVMTRHGSMTERPQFFFQHFPAADHKAGRFSDMQWWVRSEGFT